MSNRTTLPHSLSAAIGADQQKLTTAQFLALLAHPLGPRFVCQRGSKPGYNLSAYCPRSHIVYRTHSPTGLVSALKGISAARGGDLRILSQYERLSDTLDFVQPGCTSYR